MSPVLQCILFLTSSVFLIADSEWMNAALKKQAWMSSTWDHRLVASKAVDGETSANSHWFSAHTRGRERKAWWKVDLESEVQSPLVRLYFRTNYKRRRNGVLLYTSSTNSSGRGEAMLCYNVTGRRDGWNIPDILNTICYGIWRFLTVYTETDNDGKGAVLDFVEVEVWICNPGTYGDGCNKECASRHCKTQNGTCDRVTGNCPDGCTSGWAGTDCLEACANGTYGDGCKESCDARHCKTPNDTCHFVTGNCSEGCKSGWNGDDCSSVCNPGTYGDGCNKECASRHCKTQNGTCDRVTGNCPDGCTSGWAGTDCLEACANGTYGDGCKESCDARHCKTPNDTCHFVTGNCSEGCKSGWNGDDCSSEDTVSGSTFTPGSLMMIIVGSTACLLVTVIVCTMLLVCRRNSNHPRNNESAIQLDEHQPPVVADIPAEAEKRADPGEVAVANNVYCNDVTSVISVQALEATITSIEQKKDGFRKEHGMLPTGFTAPYEDSQKPENDGKNKFREYYPYDYNRIRLTRLPNIPGSDYINASLIHSFNLRRQYIAAQAPKKRTVEDFWRMIWERSCSQIVMLTSLVEGCKVKCERYWPSQDVLSTGLFRVEVGTIQNRANFTVRHLKVTSCTTTESRSVVQFHFTTWPDHGVPDTLALVNFIWMVRQTAAVSNGPLLVHCSAGIGRTGTYIAVDSLIDQARGEGVVDVLGYVSAMREQRKDMIQTPEQYQCVFHCLLEMTTYGNTSMDVDSFINCYLNSGMDSEVDGRTFSQMSEMLTNQQNNDSPDRHRMWMDGNPDFIVRVGPSMTYVSGYLQVVAPPAGSVKLLWKLVEENNVHNIVIVTPLEEDVAGKENEERKYGDVTVTTTSQTNLTSGVVLVNLTLKTKNSKISRSVKMLQIPGPVSVKDLGDLILGNAHLHHLSCQPHPVVVLHREADRTIAVSLGIMGNILCGILEDNRVDVVGHVRTFHKSCPGFHLTRDDVRWLYDFSRQCGLMQEAAGNYANL
ncbi:receptor-type tyrosine-protein phosphatase epsilon-like [Haliotis asinina]|uniref:receptor-type tyrosine-protein phosphatase epsilon-like n=1 Tax=Haliotis asinina TaxID=109174 RepID=UPI003531D6F2